MSDTNHLRELLGRATPVGEWHYCDNGETSDCTDEYGYDLVHTGDHEALHRKNGENNGRLIAAAINALPALLDCADQLAARVQEGMDGCSCDTVFWRTKKGRRVCGGSQKCTETRAALAALAAVERGEV